jgi:hypothetical protein
LAGEYAYSLALSLALLFLGLFARGVRTGKGRGLAALTLAATVVSHVIPAAFAVVGAAFLVVLELLPARWAINDDALGSAWQPGPRAPTLRPLRRTQMLWWSASTMVLAFALCAWWVVPFGLRQSYANSMGYQNVDGHFLLLFPNADRWALYVAAVGVLLALWCRSRFALLLSLLGGAAALTVIFIPQSNLYNVRFLPLWFICVYLMAGWCFAVIVASGVRAWRHVRMSMWVLAVQRAEPGMRWPRPRAARWSPGAVAGPVVALLAVLAVVVPPFILPASALPSAPGPNQVRDWADWNYTGYQGKPAYPEYHALMDTMARLGHQYGCGRAMWEYNSNLNRFGTPESLMILPYWTNGCIDSMEGLLFESSATTPYHFLNQAELSVSPSEAMSFLPYGPLDVPLGVEHLQLLGVKYFMASSALVESEARADPSLKLVATSGPWHSVYQSTVVTTTWDIFMVRNSSIVQPLLNEPAVLKGVGAGQASWLGTADGSAPIDGPSVRWYENPNDWNVELAADGPSNWPRVSADESDPPAIAVKSTKVTEVVSGDSSLSFHVSRIGTPVLVKISYFPNWQATGALGPYRVTPNLMVVVPTSHDVTLNYGTTSVNELGDFLTLLGVLALALPLPLLWRWRNRRRRLIDS